MNYTVTEGKKDPEVDFDSICTNRRIYPIMQNCSNNAGFCKIRHNAENLYLMKLYNSENVLIIPESKL
jgi:hypothetical protein